MVSTLKSFQYQPRLLVQVCTFWSQLYNVHLATCYLLPTTYILNHILYVRHSQALLLAWPGLLHSVAYRCSNPKVDWVRYVADLHCLRVPPCMRYHIIIMEFIEHSRSSIPSLARPFWINNQTHVDRRLEQQACAVPESWSLDSYSI